MCIEHIALRDACEFSAAVRWQTCEDFPSNEAHVLSFYFLCATRASEMYIGDYS